jgi:hypothetical protein
MLLDPYAKNNLAQFPMGYDRRPYKTYKNEGYDCMFIETIFNPWFLQCFNISLITFEKINPLVYSPNGKTLKT